MLKAAVQGPRFKRFVKKEEGLARGGRFARLEGSLEKALLFRICTLILFLPLGKRFCTFCIVLPAYKACLIRAVDPNLGVMALVGSS